MSEDYDSKQFTYGTMCCVSKQMSIGVNVFQWLHSSAIFANKLYNCLVITLIYSARRDRGDNVLFIP